MHSKQSTILCIDQKWILTLIHISCQNYDLQETLLSQKYAEFFGELFLFEYMELGIQLLFVALDGYTRALSFYEAPIAKNLFSWRAPQHS